MYKNLYKIDLHVHTSEVSPCGKVPAQEVVREYIAKGYNGIVITDHFYDSYFDKQGEIDWEKKIDNYFEGYRKACNEALHTDFVVLPGMEIRFNDDPNDYLVFGIDELFLYNNKELYKIGLKSFREFTRNKGLLIYQAHPFRKNMIPADPCLIDGIEVYNGNPRHDSHNDLALEYALKHELKMLSGSDFHQMMDIARGGIEFPELPKTNKELVTMLSRNPSLKLINA